MSVIADIARKTLPCLILLLMLVSNVQAQTRDTSRLPPSLSHQQTLRLFAQKRYEQAYAAAVHRFEWGDEQLHLPLGYMLRHGLGTSTDLPRARQHLSIAAKRNNASAQFEYAEMLRLGEGGAIERAEACRWYQSASSGNADAAFQAAQCALDSGQSQSGLKQLHALALQGHLGASKRLILHYRQHSRLSTLPHADYKQAIIAWLKNQPDIAHKKGKSAIQQGDYRAYAVLGETQRKQPQHDLELVKQHVELGRLFGSQLPRFAAGQRLQQQGYAKQACEFYAKAFQQGFPRAGKQIGECLQQGHIKRGKSDKTACDFFEEAFFSGDEESAQPWMQCLMARSPSNALEIAKSYSHAKQLDLAFNNPSVAERICQDQANRELATGAVLELDNGQSAIASAGLSACVLEQNGQKILVFVPSKGWLSTVTPYQLALPISRHGVTLTNLTQLDMHENLLRSDSALRAVKLQEHRDLLRTKASNNVEIQLDYNVAGQLRRYIETCSNCSNDNFNWRRQRLQELFGSAEILSDSETFWNQRWRIQNWDIQLMMKPQQGEMREVYTTR